MKSLDLAKIRLVLMFVLTTVVFGGGGFWWGRRVERLQAREAEVSLKELINVAVPAGREIDFGLFWEVWSRLEENYLEPEDIKPQEMVYGAIEGMTAALGDPYTSFLAPKENKLTKEDLAGEFAGVGIQLGFVDKTLAVMSPLSDHPAEKAGIKAGDLILHIKDEGKDIDMDTEGMSLPEAVQMIRGKRGTEVILTIFRENDGGAKEVALIREMIVVPSVELTFVDEEGKEMETGRIAHLKVIRFGEKTMQEWLEAVGKITGRKDVGGIVLDLRNNPGGFLQRAIDLAGEFMAEGVVVKQAGRLETETFKVERRGKLMGRKLVVLINKGSASASEILAGALREQLGVKLVGEKTFGKGTVQEAQELPGGAGLHITIAKWLLPSGKNIHKEGIEPDIEVKEATDSGEVDVQLIEAIKQI